MRAQTADDAPARFARGQIAYEQGNFAAAIDAWNAAYEVDPRPLLQFNIGHAQERLGHLTAAIRAYETYLAGVEPDDANAEEARSRIVTLRERIRNTGIEIAGPVEGASLFVDDSFQGRAPHAAPILLGPGAHRIMVTASGFEDFRGTVFVPAGQIFPLRVLMRRADPTARWLGPTTVMAAGAALIGTGVGLGALALDRGYAAFTNGAADGARRLALISDVLWISGAVAFGAGLTWLLWNLRIGAERTPSVGPMIARETLGLVATGSF